MVDPNTRQGKRTPVTLKIKFKSETLEQFIERYAVDVSQGGIFIRTKEPLAVGTQMRFEFQLRDASPLIAGEGTVVWTRENDPSRPAIAPGMGVRFDRLAEGSQTVLERILSEKAKQAPTRPAETTKPPMFTDTPTRVAPAPIQEALLGEERGATGRTSGGFGDQQTPLPKPVPFHSDADDFDEQAFEEATKVRAVDELVAQSALDDTGSKATPRAGTPSAPPVNKPIEPPAAEESRRVSANLPAIADAGGPIDRDSAPSLPNPPKVDSAAAKAPRLLDTTPSPRPEAASAAPPLDTPAKTKLGVEPAARPNTPTARPANRSVPSTVDDNASAAYPSKKSSAAPMAILVLFVLAAAAAGVWFFFLREKAKPEPTIATGSGSALDLGSGSGRGSAGALVGSGSGNAIDVGSGDAGSGSQMAGSDTGSNSATEPPAGPLVDTVIAANVAKSTIEVVGTDQTGSAPFTAKLEKDKAYQVKVSAAGYLPATLDIQGGAAKQTAKLEPKPKRVEVTSSPETALIYIDGRPTGMATPKTIDIPKAKLGAKSIRISIRKQGFRSVDKTLTAAAFTEGDDVMTAKVETTLEKAAAVVPRPPTGSGSAAGSGSGAGSAATGSGTPAPGGDGGTGGTGGGSSAPPPPPPPPPDEPEPNL